MPRCRSLGDTDVEQVVATSESDDFGPCGVSPQSAGSPRPVELLPSQISTVNRQESGKDAGEWMPKLRPHELPKAVSLVKLKYALSIDRKKKQAPGGPQGQDATSFGRALADPPEDRPERG